MTFIQIISVYFDKQTRMLVRGINVNGMFVQLGVGVTVIEIKVKKRTKGNETILRI